MSNEFDQEADEMLRRPDKKGFRATSKRLRAGKKNHLGHRGSLQWRQDARVVCAPFEDDIDPDMLSRLPEVISKSRTGRSLLEDGGKIELCFDPQTAISQFYPCEKRRLIALNPYHPFGDLLNTLSRELRRAWQHAEGALVNPLDYDPDEAVLINRAQQADAFMISIKIAWELKLIGESEAWNALVGSPIADVSRTFEVHAQKDFRSLNNGEASRAAYDKFFEESRTKLCDKRIIHQMLLDDSGYMRPPLKRPKAEPALFHKLGSLPHGRNYLAIKGKKSPTDVSYATVEDRSNANFLWFVKFERSFQEKEMRMLEESVRTSAEIVDFAKWSMRAPKPDAGSDTDRGL